MGMIGGGEGAFIGGVHRIAAALDQQVDLVAGVFSRDPANSSTTGQRLFLDPARVYRTYEEMAEREARLPSDRRIDFVVIVTPNHAHFGPAKIFLERLPSCATNRSRRQSMRRISWCDWSSAHSSCSR
jgi:predicted dehydrogenase